MSCLINSKSYNEKLSVSELTVEKPLYALPVDGGCTTDETFTLLYRFFSKVLITYLPYPITGGVADVLVSAFSIDKARLFSLTNLFKTLRCTDGELFLKYTGTPVESKRPRSA